MVRGTLLVPTMMWVKGSEMVIQDASLWMESIDQRMCLCLEVSYLILGRACATCAYLA